VMVSVGQCRTVIGTDSECGTMWDSAGQHGMYNDHSMYSLNFSAMRNLH
jgi:hypothetical protein